MVGVDVLRETNKERKSGGSKWWVKVYQKKNQLKQRISFKHVTN